jgi:hypothetical protein
METTPISTSSFRHCQSSTFSQRQIQFIKNPILNQAILLYGLVPHISLLFIHNQLHPQRAESNMNSSLPASSSRPQANLGNHTGGFQAAWEKHQHQHQQPSPLHDATTRHPVFFTDRLRRSPLAGPANPGPLNSPVAQGYAYQETPGKTSGPRL